VRIDPIIPTVNSDEEDFELIISKAAEIGVKQITASTMKPVRGFFKALRARNSDFSSRLHEVYADGEWVSGYKYLGRDRRAKVLKGLRKTVLKAGLEFAACREGLPHLNTTICDGTAYCRELLGRFAC